MAYPKGHRDRTRVQIIDSARRLFNRKGFENVSIDAIMADAGLTRGAFYSYFRSKSSEAEHKFRCGQFSQYGHSLVTCRTWSEMRESHVN